MNTERPVIRPFKDLEDLEKLVSGIQLRIISNLGPKNLLNGQTYISDYAELRSLSISILWNFEGSAIKKAIEKIGISLDDVKIVAVVDSAFMRNRKVIEIGNFVDLNEAFVVASRGAQRDEVLMDRRHGFDVDVQFLLVKQLMPKPLMPYRKGTELARASFSVKPLPEGDGLSPEPLDGENRDRLKLSSAIELFVEVDSPLLEMKTFEGNLVIWMNEDLYNLCVSQKSKSSERYLEAAANNALTQLVYLVSAELQNVEIEKIEGDPPMVVNVLKNHFDTQNAKSLLGESSFASMLKSSPEKIAAVFSGFGGNVSKWKKMLDGEEQEEGETV